MPSDTTLAAYDRINVTGRASALRAAVYSAILHAGLKGLTYSELKVMPEFAGIDHSTLSPRLWELAGGNAKRPFPKLIIDLGERRANPSGNKERVHFAAELLKPTQTTL